MASRSRRPEHSGPPELFYDQNEARKYVRNSRMIDIQTRMTERALELLCLPEGQPSYLLDIGCGTGLSGDYISEEGHYWVGIDISSAMLDAALDRDTEGDLLLGDMGQGVPFRPGSFDGCISISAVQWLCNANKKSDVPARRLYRFFSSLYSALVRGARAVLQLYPENSEQLELITTQATRAGFTGGVVVDFPNSAKAKKFYLCLFSGPSTSLPKGLTESQDADQATESAFTSERAPHKKARRDLVKKSREWVLEKKERRRRQGKKARTRCVPPAGHAPLTATAMGHVCLFVDADNTTDGLCMTPGCQPNTSLDPASGTRSEQGALGKPRHYGVLSSLGYLFVYSGNSRPKPPQLQSPPSLPLPSKKPPSGFAASPIPCG